MNEQYSRSVMLMGEDAFRRLRSAKVAVCGIGGVGSYAAEGLARSGVGPLMLIDHDTVALSNCNRQLPALHSTLGQSKAEVMKARIADIDPEITVEALPLFLTGETEASLFEGCDYIVDAVDNVTAKLRLAEISLLTGIPLIAAMGCGNKTDPSLLQITDLFKTETCPLCKVMRRECKARGIHRLTVIFSKEPPHRAMEGSTPASTVFVPATAGLRMAAYVTDALTRNPKEVKA